MSISPFYTMQNMIAGIGPTLRPLNLIYTIQTALIQGEVFALPEITIVYVTLDHGEMQGE
jgi:hypothetical protein